ncbi:hypothetical protein ACHAQJ_004093 [Trichoderma viride]
MPAECQPSITPNESLQENKSITEMKPPDIMGAGPADDQSTHYRNPKQILGVKPVTYVYPHADERISMEHRRRFPVIVDIFQQNLHEHNKLSLKHPTKTEYKLKMCGGSMHDAQPSILVSHPWNDPKTGLLILKILTKKRVRDQYESCHKTARFKIYLFLRPSFKYLGYPAKSLDIRMKDSYFPGALLVSGDIHERVSTISCGIRFPTTDDTYFALTSAHAFKEIYEGLKESTETGEASETSEDEEGSEEAWGWQNEIADVEYDLAELMQYENIYEKDQISKASVQLRDDSEAVQEYAGSHVQISDTKVIKPSRVWGPGWAQLSNLDWALIEIDPGQRMIAANRLHVISDLGDNNRKVRVITSRGSLHGTICSIPTFIANSSTNSSLCEVWAVTLAEQNDAGMQKGGSGALVIDSLTEQPYGYVIAANHFQELYVVSLDSALQQISKIVPLPYVEPEVFMNIVPNPLLSPGQGNIFKELMRNFSQYWALVKTDNSPVPRQPARFNEPHVKYMNDWKNNEEMLQRLGLQPIFEDGGQASSMMSRQADSTYSQANYLPSLNSSYTSRGTLMSGSSSYASTAPTVASSSARLGSYDGPFEWPPLPITAKISKTVEAPISPGQKWQSKMKQDSQRQREEDWHQLLERPPPDVPLEGKEISRVSTSLTKWEQETILIQINDYLSTCVFNFFDRHQLPISLLQNTRSGEGPKGREFVVQKENQEGTLEDCDWDEWVSRLKFLMDKQLIPAETLHQSLATQFETVLDSSLGIHYGFKQLEDSLLDDGNILEVISAGILVAKMLDDPFATGELKELYGKTEAMIESRTKTSTWKHITFACSDQI